MVRGQILRKTTRHWGPVILAGAAGLAAGIAGLAAFGRDALVRALSELPAPVAGAAICALLALTGWRSPRRSSSSACACTSG